MNRTIVDAPFICADEIAPPLKWAGGKRWLVQRHRSFFPASFRTYFEPFFGSGALFFSLKPCRAVISDSNAELMNFYEAVREQPQLVARYLSHHSQCHSPEYYYCVRSQRPRSQASRAARFLYLNRTCWNGLYRVNRAGHFNVPIGTKTRVKMESDDFGRIGQLLRSAEIVVSDFEATIDRAGNDDFVFVDPPYTVAHNNNGFLKYNEKIFSWDDQIRLSMAVKSAVNRGAKVLVTNANHQSVTKLYREYEQVVITRSGVIAASSSARGAFDELVVRCF